MTHTLTAPRNLTLFALLTALMFALMFSATSTRAEEPDAPQVIIDCFDIELEHFVPCEDIEGGPVLTPSECPEGTVANPIPGTPYFSCDDPGVPFTCDRIAVAIEKGIPLSDEHYIWYKLNCFDEPDCYEGPAVFTHVPTIPPCDEPDLSCERIDWAISQGHELPGSYLEWYNENCVDDDYNCRELAHAIAIGALLSQDVWDWYHENCVDTDLTCEDVAEMIEDGGIITIELHNWYEKNCERDELTCEDIEKIIADGGAMLAETYDWYERNCLDDDLTCLDVPNLMQAGEATEEQEQWYERNCPDTTTELDCEDGPAAFESLDEYNRLCGEPTCEDKFSFPSLDAYLEECEEIEEECTVDCEPVIDECEIDCEPQTQEICEVDCEPQVEETPETDPTPTPEITFQPEAPKPPKAGAGQLFTTGTQGFGLASIALVVLGGALAGTLLRRKA